MKLLLAIDSSPVSKTVVDEVAKRPWPPGTTACVLNIIDWPQLQTTASVIEAVKQSADSLVKSASAELSRVGLPATTKILEGHPRTAVAEFAEEWSADLVLVGSHGASGLVRFLLGSVAQATLRRAPCSVEIVRKPERDSTIATAAMRILIATDGSDCATAAVKSVAHRPWPDGSQIRVVSVIPFVIPAGEMISPTLGPVDASPNVVEALQKEARGRAEEAVSRALHVLTDARIKPVKTELLQIGDAREVILDQAKDWAADLIVVGSHGYHGIDRLTLGSVSESVAMHAYCSVEVIRES